MGQSPLGQFAPVVAASAAIGIVAAFAYAALANNAIALAQLHDPLLIAIGAIFGSAAAVPAINGYVGRQTEMNTLRGASNAARIAALESAPNGPDAGGPGVDKSR